MRTLVNRRHSGPKMTALVAMQRVLMAVIVSSMALAALISGLGSRPLLAEHTMALLIFDVVLAGVCIAMVVLCLPVVVGVFPLGLLFVLAFQSGSDGIRPWLPVGLLTTITMYLLITSSSKILGLVIAIAGPAFFVLVLVPHAGTNDFLGPAVDAYGWLAAIQYLGAGLGCWWAWNHLSHAAKATDEEYEKSLALVRESVEAQAEHRAWRESARRVHETVLNTITYVLSTATIDRYRLQQLLSGVEHQSRLDVSAIQFTPETHSTELVQTSKPIAQSRLLLACVLSGNVIAGIVYLPAVIHDAYLSSIVAVALIASVFIATGWVAFLRRSPLGNLSYILVFGSALVPFVLLLVQPGCSDVPLIAGIVNVAGFSTLACALWSRSWIGVSGLAIWVVGCFVITSQTPSQCQAFPVVGFFNTIVAIPVALAAVYVSEKALATAELKRRYEEERSDVLVGLARGEEAFNSELSGVIADAEICLTDIAEGAEFDAKRQATLFRIDSRIRAAMVVDTRSAGSFAVLAKTLVDRASIYGVSVKVRDLASSDDREPVGPELTDLLLEVILQAGNDQPVIGVMMAGNLDMLSLRVSAGAAARCGLTEGTSRIIGHVHLDVEESADNVRTQDANNVVIVLSRTVQ